MIKKILAVCPIILKKWRDSKCAEDKQDYTIITDSYDYDRIVGSLESSELGWCKIEKTFRGLEYDYVIVIQARWLGGNNYLEALTRARKGSLTIILPGQNT